MTEPLPHGDSSLPPDLPERLDGLFAAAFGVGSAGGVRTTVRLRELGVEAMRAAALAAGGRVEGRYSLGEEVGRGGMGVVYLGFDLELGRAVAIKTLQERHANDSRVQARFAVEAQIGGQLQHPGLVPVHEFGRWSDGRPFFAMKLVTGESYAALLERSRDEAERWRCLQVFAAVSQAVAYAHAHGVVHRDLKPTNVMVGRYGEVQVLDWGLAKVLGQEEAAGEPLPSSSPVAGIAGTEAGAVLGTPAYMAPEQARGEQSAVDQRSDVFSLGSMLCELLTGLPAYAGSRVDVLARARVADLVAAQVALAGCGGPAELVALARQCLSPQPADRPANAQVVADAVTGYLATAEQRRRDADLAVAAAEARADAERRARRLVVAFGVTILITVLGGLAWQSQSESRRLQRRAGAGQAVQAALSRAQQAVATARAKGKAGDEAWATALVLAGQADALASVSDVDPELQAETHALAARTRQGQAEFVRANEHEQADRRLLASLAAGRELAMAALKPADWPPVAKHFHSSFATHGIVLADPSATVADRVRGRAVATSLIDGLDWWLHANMMIPEGAGDAERLRQLLSLLDPDPWRERVRRATLRDLGELRVLARDEAAGKQSTSMLLLFGMRMMHAGEFGVALPMLDFVSQCRPDDFELHMWLSQFDGRAARRLQHAIAAVALRPASAEARREWVDGLAGTAPVAEMERFLDVQAAACPDDPEIQLFWIGTLIQTDPARALELAKQRLAMQPGAYRWLAMIGAAELEQGKDEGRLWLRRLAVHEKPDPQVHEALHRLGISLSQRALHADAELALREAVRLDSLCPRCRSQLASAIYAQERFEDAMAVAREGIAIEPADPMANAILGWSLAALGRRHESIEPLRLAARGSDCKPQTLTLLASVLLETPAGIDEADGLLRRALRLSPDDPDARYQQAFLFLRCGAYERGIATLEGLTPSSSSCALLAELCLRLGKVHAAQVWAAQGSSSATNEQERAAADSLQAKVEAAMKRADEANAVTAPKTAEQAAQLLSTWVSAGRYVAAARKVLPGLARGLPASARAVSNRFRLACVVALAGGGCGVDAADAEAAERAAFRDGALRALWADLEVLANKDSDLPRAGRRIALQWWLEQPDLEPCRAEAKLRLLPESEQVSWRELWTSVADELARLGG